MRKHIQLKKCLFACMVLMLAGCVTTPENVAPATPDISQANEAQPDNNPEALFNLAIAYTQDAEKNASPQSRAKAIATFNKVLQLAPGNVTTLKALYTLYYNANMQGDNDAFVQTTAIFRQLPPASRTQLNPPSLAKFISQYVQQKKTGQPHRTELYRTLLAATQEQPLNDNVYMQLAKMYSEERYYPLALATLKSGAEQITTSPELYKALATTYEARAEAEGCIYEHTHYLSSAIIWYQRAIALNPDNAELHYALARMYFAKNLSQLGHSETGIAIALKPTAENLIFAAQNYSLSGHQKKADDLLEQAKTSGLTATNPGAHEIYMNSGEWMQAALSFTQYIQAQQHITAYDVIKADVIHQQTEIDFAELIASKKLLLNNAWENALLKFWTNKIPRKQLEHMAANSCQRTEYFFYTGYRDYIAGNKRAAQQHFTAALQQNTYRFIERPLARHFLNASH